MTAANAATNKDLTTEAPIEANALAPVAADASGAAKAAARLLPPPGRSGTPPTAG